MKMEFASSERVSIYLSDCCRNNSVNLCHHPDFEFVVFKVPDNLFYFILKLMLWTLI